MVCGTDWGSKGKPALAPVNPEGRKQEALLGDRGEAILRDGLSCYLLILSLIKNARVWFRCRQQSPCGNSHTPLKIRDLIMCKEECLWLLTPKCLHHAQPCTGPNGDTDRKFNISV